MAQILIIDDDPAVRDYLCTLITRLGHQPTPAATCSEALAAMDAPGIEVIISDIYLPDNPDLSGWIDQLKQHAAGRPLILITGEPSEELAAKSRGGGITAFLSKPFELAFIKNLLAQATRKPDNA